MEKIKAEVKQLFSSGLVEGLEHWSPSDPSKFGIWVQVFIGETGDDRFDSFDVVVCSPSWLDENWGAGMLDHYQLTPNIRLGYGLLFMQRWDHDELQTALRQLVDRVEATDWGDLANRIGRYLPWEYDYRYDDHQDKGRSIP